MKSLNYLLLATFCLLLFSCGGGNKAKENTASTEEAEGEDRGYIVKVGDMAPDFTFTTTSGETVKLSDLRGRVVMLQFTASWCSVCRKEMPFIEKDIWQKHKDNPGFALYGIDRDEPLETVKEFAVQTGITYPLALDPGADIFALFADRNAGITRNVIVNREGQIVMLTRLYDEAEFAAMCQKIDELLH
jgi:peroxiredoxin